MKGNQIFYYGRVFVLVIHIWLCITALSCYHIWAQCVVISAAQHIIRQPSCGKLFHCCRFTLWLSTKTQECNARICSTQLLCLTRMRLVWRELNREIWAKRLFIYIFYFALDWNIAWELKYFNNCFHSGHSFYASLWKKLKLNGIFYLLTSQKKPHPQFS